jgi:hypothetical protein
MTRKPLWKTLFIVCVLATSGCMRGDWSDEAVKVSKERGDVIIAALKRYHHQYNDYPDHLDDLVPAFLAEIPLPIAGNKQWAYRRFSSDDCELGVVGYYDGDPKLYRRVQSRGWSLDTGW